MVARERGYRWPMTNEPVEQQRQDEIVGQSDDVRDPADDSGEIDDPTEMADTYPGAFDGSSAAAAAAIREHDARDDERHGSGNGVPGSPNRQREPRRAGPPDAAAEE